MSISRCVVTYVLVIVFAYQCETAFAQGVDPGQSNGKRLRILVTNDNGIEDPKIVALARALSKNAEVYVVAPESDQSGTGARLTFLKTGKLSAKRRDIGKNIVAWAVNGTPGDCVVFAGAILMADNPPDLVVSGINGGANMGMEWLYSGTVGAARVAALGGIPAIAVSGLDDDLPGSVDAAVEWVVRFVDCDSVKNLKPGEYLTVSLPPTEPNRIRGVKVVNRATGLPNPKLEKVDESTWRLVGMDASEISPPPNSDVAAVMEGYIAVVPMRLDEVDELKVQKWQKEKMKLPKWNRRQMTDSP